MQSSNWRALKCRVLLAIYFLYRHSISRIRDLSHGSIGNSYEGTQVLPSYNSYRRLIRDPFSIVVEQPPSTQQHLAEYNVTHLSAISRSKSCFFGPTVHPALEFTHTSGWDVPTASHAVCNGERFRFHYRAVTTETVSFVVRRDLQLHRLVI